MLYPVNSQYRVLLDLGGIWNFELGTVEGFGSDVIQRPIAGGVQMAVPASFNDVGALNSIRNHVGWVRYEREFIVPRLISDERIVLRFGSVTHFGRIFINGVFVGEHIGGFTPFEFEINSYVQIGVNRLSVLVNNIVDDSTLPVGTVITSVDSNGVSSVKNNPNFDFFNYAGIHRPVKIYTTPKTFISDVEVVTTIDGNRGVVDVNVEIANQDESRSYEVRGLLFDEDHTVVAQAVFSDQSFRFEVDDVHLWEPMNAYLYSLELNLFEGGEQIDSYSVDIGVRTVEVRDSKFLINGKPFYFKGFGKHEDFAVHGRGFDEALNLLDVNLMKWLGANSFRTAHYPYSEEMMLLADRQGIVVIDEVPAVGLHLNFAAALFGAKEHKNTWENIKTFENHQNVITELIERDKNHPSVVMWSIANEPASEESGAYEYFEPLVALAKELDPSKRPVTIVTHQWATPGVCEVAPLIDVIALNRYYGWYVDSGDLSAASEHLLDEITKWQELFPEKPIVFTEYGADTVAGLHDVDPVMFTEEYQSLFLQTYHQVFDKCSSVVGEQVWNFADFNTTQGVLRVQGNKKGVFTRDRKPKAAAHELRARWQNVPNYFYK
ncbi:MAG: beta-glucuronidase [Actinomycetota bacterium]|nr:beta-glucuronidase [Actinomycetota bacterium]